MSLTSRLVVLTLLAAQLALAPLEERAPIIQAAPTACDDCAGQELPAPPSVDDDDDDDDDGAGLEPLLLTVSSSGVRAFVAPAAVPGADPPVLRRPPRLVS
jgi:hypothetical protein